MIVTAFEHMEYNNLLEDKQILFFKQADVRIPYSPQNVPFSDPRQQIWFGICLPLSSSLERSSYFFTNTLLC